MKQESRLRTQGSGVRKTKKILDERCCLQLLSVIFERYYSGKNSVRIEMRNMKQYLSRFLAIICGSLLITSCHSVRTSMRAHGYSFKKMEARQQMVNRSDIRQKLETISFRTTNEFFNNSFQPGTEICSIGQVFPVQSDMRSFSISQKSAPERNSVIPHKIFPSKLLINTNVAKNQVNPGSNKEIFARWNVVLASLILLMGAILLFELAAFLGSSVFLYALFRILGFLVGWLFTVFSYNRFQAGKNFSRKRSFHGMCFSIAGVVLFFSLSTYLVAPASILVLFNALGIISAIAIWPFFIGMVACYPPGKNPIPENRKTAY